MRSVQRISNPSKKTALWVAQSYPVWLSKIFNRAITAEESKELLEFKLFGNLPPPIKIY